MPTSPPYLRGYPVEKRRDVWLQWAFENISPVFNRFPGERAYVVFQLENLEWIGNCSLPPANSDSDAWCRLKQIWGPAETPPKGTIPSVADCEVVRLLNKGYVHEYIELNLRKHGWDPYKCCDPSLKVEQKRLNAPSPAKPSSSAAATPTSTGTRIPFTHSWRFPIRSRWKRSCYRWTGWHRFWTWRPVTKTFWAYRDYPFYPRLAEANNFFPFQAPDKTDRQRGRHSSTHAFSCCASEPERWFRVHWISKAYPGSPEGSRVDTHKPSGSTFGEEKDFSGRGWLLGQPETPSLNKSTAFNTSVSEGGVSGIKNAGGGSTENQTKRHASPGHQTGNPTVEKHNTPSRGVPSSSKPVVSSGVPIGDNKGSVGARVIMNPPPAVDPSIAVQDPAKSYDELKGDSFGRRPRSVHLAKDLTPQNVECTLQSHNSQSRPAAEKKIKTQSPAIENLQTTVTPKEEHLRVNDDLHKNNIERMSAKLFKSSRPTLHAYLRDEIEAMSKTVMGNMRKRTVEVLGRQSNSHLGFATLRDVEELTLAMMEAEINSARKAALEQIDKLDKQGSDVPIKREASELEGGGVAEHAREAKRHRTSNSASSQDCVQS
ncbi:hypothetical protein CGLO_13177 [Colletotrichum gloeosporioides Cg-14]|uniref:Uncharacterized protein n=1 Tax=Colletotrichum gloeosporioides (strain Cg-14) TaxID=1237896 RepID=T0K6Q4_COLGC|nr:hypothetical protein CGLO_13177 [Colletotrichum gloeosporioides Cg-14]